MLEQIDLFEFEVIVAPELGAASSHRVGGFQQVVTKVAITGLDEFGVLDLEIAGLVLGPDTTGVLGNRCLGIETADIVDLSDDTGGVDLTNARNGGKCVGNDLELLLNGFVQFYLAF